MKKFKALLAVGAVVMGAIVSGCGDNNKDDPIKPDPDPVEPDKIYYNGTYTNDIYPYSFGNEYKGEIADPSIVKGDDGKYYIFSTARVAFVSEDCCTWEKMDGYVIDRPTWGDAYCKSKGYSNPEVWAPDCYKVGDKWIYYYSLSAWNCDVGIGYAVADNVGGPYTDMGELFWGREIGIDNCIDPCLYIEDDGTIYMAVGSFRGIFLVKLTDDGTELEGGVEKQKEDKVLIAGRVGQWDGSTYEGSYIIKKDDYYYYFGSCGSCCEGVTSSYMVRVGRSKNIEGPYLDSQNKKLTDSGGSTSNGDIVVWKGIENELLAGPGHCSIMQDDKGEYWMFYHSYTKTDNFKTRHLMLDKLLWDEKTGMPYVETKKPSYQVEKDGPAIEED